MLILQQVYNLNRYCKSAECSYLISLQRRILD